MPHLTLPIGVGGPIIDLLIGVSAPRADALKAAGQPIPVNVNARLLVDTGASCTCIDPGILSSLGLTPTGTTTIHTPSTQGTGATVNQFDVSIVLVHTLVRRTWRAWPVIESQLIGQGIQGLLGRDILASCLLTYDGTGQTFCLGF
jgi:hypothetical protein